MNPRYFGDSYDIVKHSLLRWLASLGPWNAHPMFTEAANTDQADGFSALLGVPLLSIDVLAQGQNRAEYFAVARSCSTHLFLDPDTGIRAESAGSKKPAAYVFVDELVSIASRRPELLTLVFDQALSHGSEAAGLREKLSLLGKRELHGFAYRSHACFLLIGPSDAAVHRAHEVLLNEAHLPAGRFVLGDRMS